MICLFTKEMGPDPTRAYFWPAVNKRLTPLQPGYFLTQLEENILSWREKIEKFDVFWRNFPNSSPNHKWLTQPEPQKIDPTRPRSKIFDPDPSLVHNEQFLRSCVKIITLNDIPLISWHLGWKKDCWNGLRLNYIPNYWSQNTQADGLTNALSVFGKCPFGYG